MACHQRFQFHRSPHHHRCSRTAHSRCSAFPPVRLRLRVSPVGSVITVRLVHFVILFAHLPTDQEPTRGLRCAGSCLHLPRRTCASQRRSPAFPQILEFPHLLSQHPSPHSPLVSGHALRPASASTATAPVVSLRLCPIWNLRWLPEFHPLDLSKSSNNSMRPRLSKKDLTSSPVAPRSYTPSPGPKVPHHLATKRIPPLIIAPHGKTFVQNHWLPRLPGQVGFAGDRPPERQPASVPSVAHNAPAPQDDIDDNPFIIPYEPDPVDDVRISRHRRKRERQWERWQQEAIPSLIAPYMELTCATKSLRDPVPMPGRKPCTCAGHGRILNVVLVRFDSLEKISLTICACSPAPRQLLDRGFFACAPLTPSLAVDLKVLDFVSTLFVNVAPNNTAWCSTVETFLLKQGYKLTTKDSLRKRFGNALQWYNALQDATTRHVNTILKHVRRLQLDLDDGIDVAHNRSNIEPITALANTPMQTPRASRTSRTAPAVTTSTPTGTPRASVTPVACTSTQTLRATQTSVVPPTAATSTPAQAGRTATTPSTSTPVGRNQPRYTVTIEDVDDEDDTPQADSSATNAAGDQDAPRPPGATHTTQRRKRSRTADDNGVQGDEEDATLNPFPDPPPRVRPSDYLRSRCPLCFGGKTHGSDPSWPDAIVCIDACFTQKRNRQARDPPRTHPNTVFVPEADADRMQHYVESIRPTKSKAPKRTRRAKDGPEEDGFEGPLRVPTSVLDGCEAGFTAADDRREKASTQFFDDTALMALLCRHDIVLWIVNMRSAGEKQHYTLVLLETLFQHLPQDFTIGILYDIGCQLHRSCVKWGFLDRYMDRILFAISVFHAFGHQWPCQIIYHPRKCRGFGLSDGEGCERFWHSISKLIAYLRVCGYHQRLYTLDKQVEHAHATILIRLGQWLLRRSQHCHSKRLEAEAILAACDYTEEFLRAQWDAQVIAQTKPLPRRSRTQGKTAVEEAIRLRKARDIHKRRVEELEAIMLDPTTDADMFVDAEMHLDDARAALERASANVVVKERALGVDSRAELHRLVNSPFISARMNARAVKTRLRERLRARKFELDRLERSFRKQVNDQKINSHTESSVKRRDPSIQQLARNYNTLCDQMAQLIRDKKAPRNARCPEKISLKGLFALDVDDNIWQDIGLEDDASSTELPPWLSNDNVRSGIKALLERDRCLEEQARIQHECRSMREWFSEEWEVINNALSNTVDVSLTYQLQMRRYELCGVCAIWQKSVQSINVGSDPLPQWGPSPQEILEVSVASVVASLDEHFEEVDNQSHGQLHDDDDCDDAFDNEADLEESDVGLVETLDALDLADAFRSIGDDLTW